MSESLIDKEKFKGDKKSLYNLNCYRNSILAAENMESQLNAIILNDKNRWEVNMMIRQVQEVMGFLKFRLEEGLKNVRRR